MTDPASPMEQRVEDAIYHTTRCFDDAPCREELDAMGSSCMAMRVPSGASGCAS